MKYAFLVALALLASCDRGSDKLPQIPESEIFLHCSGEQISSSTSEREQVWSLIKVNNKSPQGHLQYYRQEDQRFFPSACHKNFSDCQLTVNADVIEERGTIYGDDKRPLLSVITTINRRTGKMLEERIDSRLERITTFEGTCEKSDPPAVQAPKF